MAADRGRAGGRPAAGDVVPVAGPVIGQRNFDHWLRVVAIGGVTGSPRSPLIVPLAPPRFASCIAQLRRSSTAQRRPARRGATA